jgi:hypothetical protein
MSVSTMTEGPAVMIGYPWRLQIEAAAPVFVEGAAYAGQLRLRASDPTVLATISSAEGGVLRVSDTVLELALRPDQTLAWHPGGWSLISCALTLIPICIWASSLRSQSCCL